MKKIPNLFERDWKDAPSRVLPVLNSTADVAWVLAGEGVPTVKWDGAAVMIRDAELYVRYDAKGGKTPPPGFLPCQDADPVTGHRPGWIAAAGNPAAKWHVDALVKSGGELADGTYEALGPQHQSNPYGFPHNLLIRHGKDPLSQFVDASRLCEGPAAAWFHLRDVLSVVRHQHPLMPLALPIEGIVWHHPDGRMVKVLSSDLGVAWKAKARQWAR